MSDTATRLRALVGRIMSGVRPDAITDETHFERDLGGDSLDAFELVMAVEDDFQIDLPTESIEAIETFGDLRRLVDRALDG